MRFLRSIAILSLVVMQAVGVPALSEGVLAATCTEGSGPGCPLRVIPEPEAAAAYIQHDLDYANILRKIEAIAPRYVEIFDAATLAPHAGVTTTETGRTIWVVRVTDEQVTTPKTQVAATLSSHGDEPAGREGGLRFLEDLVRWAAYKRSHVLSAGDTSITVGTFVTQAELWLSVPNPNGWAAGDAGAWPFTGFQRTNFGTQWRDLNREFPTLGWRTTTHLVAAEAKLWAGVLESLSRLSMHVDIHGETSSATNSFVDVMWPAGQWDPIARRRHRDQGYRIVEVANRRMAEAMANGTPPEQAPKPADVANAYDIVGYDDSGFLGDWMAQRGVTSIDVEIWPNLRPDVGPSTANTVYSGVVERLRVAAVRAVMEATLVGAFAATPTAPAAGSLLVIDDGVRVASPTGLADRLRWFDELAARTATPVQRVAPDDVTASMLSGVDTVVLADVDQVAVAPLAPLLRDHALAGGQVLLTDRSVELVDDLGLAGQIVNHTHVAGHVDFGERTHAWEAGLPAHASQTYTEVPLGYHGRVAQSPHFGVMNWPGVTVATVATSAGAATALGEVALGTGRVAIFGAVLPRQKPGAAWLGLTDHGVSVAAGEVLERILAYRR